MNHTEKIHDSLPIIQKLFHRNDRKDRKLQKQHAIRICNQSIHSRWIRRSFQQFDYGQSQTDRKGNIIGLALWKEYRTTIPMSIIPEPFIPQAYLYLLCAEPSDMKLGTKILSDVESQCRQQKFGQIRLEAIPSLERWYESFGQHLTDSFRREYLKPFKENLIKKCESVPQEEAITHPES